MISQLIILVVLILINAYFAATEIAFVSLNDAKIEKNAKEGNKKAKQILKMLKAPSKFLATIQIGITLAGFLSSAFAADTFADKLVPVLNNIMYLGEGPWRTISIIIITMILSYFTLVFGELVPKRLAMKNPEKISYATVGVIRVISTVTLPFVKLLTTSTNVISKLFGVSETEEENVTEEEIRMMIDVGKEKGSINEEEKEMINNIFELNDKSVSEVMVHRTDIFAINVESEISDIMDQLDAYKYSRIPVYENNIDEIIGLLYAKDLLRFLNSSKKIKIKDLMRTAYFVSENKMINDLFRDMQRNKTQIAIVLDEYGGTAGLVTMEDILEEIVGNIFDEYDDEEIEFERIDENTYKINGSVSIFDLEKELSITIPDGDYDTLSGFLIELLGRIPQEGENPVIETKDVTYKIEEYEDKRIVWVKACKNHTEEVSEDEDEDLND